MGVSMSKNNTKKYKAVVWDIMQFMFSDFNDHQLHCVMKFDSHIDENYLKKTIDMSANIFPIIKCKFVEKSYFKFPYWEECTFTSKEMVRMVETENVEENIEKCIVYKTKEHEGPQLRVNIIRSKSYDCLCIIMNHMVCDAAGFKEYLYMLSSIYSNLKKDIYYKPDFVMGSRSIKQLFSKFSILDKIKILFSSSQLSKYSSGIVFPLKGDINNPFIVKHKISKDRFLFIKAYAKKNNSTINDIILTAYIRALRKVLNCSITAIPCPVDLRKYLPDRKAEAICNLTSNMVCDIGFDIGENYNETVLKVKQSMDKEKKSFSCLNGPLMLEIIFKILPYKIAKKCVSKLFSNPTIAITNIGIIHKNKLIFHEANITDIYISGSIKYNPYFQLAVATFDNEITLSINFYGTKEDKEKINEFLFVLDKELAI
jgi:NRPS condensation-like uncharacterized protein